LPFFGLAEACENARRTRSKFGGISVSDAKRLKELEIENTRRKKLLADALLENEVTSEP
jgi:putative transposase